MWKLCGKMMKKNLSDREKKILRLRFAIDRPKKAQTTAKETLETVGEEIGVSHNRVKVIESEALEKLGIPMSDVYYNRNQVREIIEAL